MPKGVVWRHEDVFRVLGGGIDFMTGGTLADECDAVAEGAEPGRMVTLRRSRR